MLHLHLQQEPVDILVAINGHDGVQIISLISNSTSSDFEFLIFILTSATGTITIV